jgi:thioredoxin reductase (NADPH)
VAGNSSACSFGALTVTPNCSDRLSRGEKCGTHGADGAAPSSHPADVEINAARKAAGVLQVDFLNVEFVIEASSMSSDTLTDGAPAEAVNPTDPYERRAQTFPKLTEQQVERAAEFGVVQALPRGTVLFDRGDRTVDFFIVLEGTIEIYEPKPSGPTAFTTLGPRQFTGELDLFSDRENLVGGRMATIGRVIRTRRAQFRRLLVAEPDIAEIVMRAFILRRVGILEHEQAASTLIGSRTSGDTLRIHRFLERNGYPVRPLDPDVSQEGRDMLAERGLGLDDLPVVITAYAQVLKNPSNRELAVAVGLVERLDADAVFDVAVVGAGPAGLAAAVYSASEGLSTLVLEAEAPGGQAGTSSKIENYLGFPTGISGQALAGRAQVQAQKFGARLAVPRRVVRLTCNARPYALELDDGERVHARTVVIATGAHYRKLALENFDRFEGYGIHYAATAMEAALCEREEVVVVGGGNSAGQAAVFLSHHASRVHVLVRSVGLAASMSDYLIGRIAAAKNIVLHTETEISRLDGKRHLEQVTWRNRRTGAQEDRAISNVFLMLGAMPNTEWLRDCVRLDEAGFVRCGAAFEARGDWQTDRLPYALETSRRGVFAVGDVRSGSIKRVASSVGEGSIVVSAIHSVLSEM